MIDVVLLNTRSVSVLTLGEALTHQSGPPELHSSICNEEQKDPARRVALAAGGETGSQGVFNTSHKATPVTNRTCSHPIMHSDDSGTYCSWCGKLLAANKLWPELNDTSALAREQNRLGDWSVLKNDGHWWVRYLRGVFALTQEGWQRADAEREMRRRVDSMIRERDMAMKESR